MFGVTVHINTVFLKNFRPLFSYLTSELLQIFITFNITDVSLFKQANKSMEKDLS